MGEYYISRGNTPDEEVLLHYGVLGMKWGQRRYTNANGSANSAGIAKYRPNRVAGNVARALTNGSVGQRVIGVGTNKGYRKDKAEIRAKRNELKKSYKKITDKKVRSQKIKTLKKDYKKTLGEARENAASVLYPWQGKAANKKIQTSNLGKQVAKSTLMGSYGTLNYDRMSSNKINKGASAAAGILSSMADNMTYGVVSAVDYTSNKKNYSTRK